MRKSAVFNKDAKRIGELNQLEVVGAKVLRDNLKYGVIVAANPANPARIITYEIYETKIKVKPVLEGEQLKLNVTAKFIGTLGENQETHQDAFDHEYANAAEHAVADEITRLTKIAYQRQQQLKADVSELGPVIYRAFPQYWEKIKDRWDEEIFPTVPLEVKVEVLIRRPVIMH